jgi:hypothetical protein
VLHLQHWVSWSHIMRMIVLAAGVQVPKNAHTSAGQQAVLSPAAQLAAAERLAAVLLVRLQRRRQPPLPRRSLVPGPLHQRAAAKQLPACPAQAPAQSLPATLGARCKARRSLKP